MSLSFPSLSLSLSVSPGFSICHEMLRRMLQLQSYDSVDLVLLVPSAKLEGSPIAVRIPIRMLAPDQ